MRKPLIALASAFMLTANPDATNAQTALSIEPPLSAYTYEGGVLICYPDHTFQDFIEMNMTYESVDPDIDLANLNAELITAIQHELVQIVRLQARSFQNGEALSAVRYRMAKNHFINELVRILDDMQDTHDVVIYANIGIPIVAPGCGLASNDVITSLRDAFIADIRDRGYFTLPRRNAMAFSFN